MYTRSIILIVILLTSVCAWGQINFQDTIKQYDVERMVIDVRGNNIRAAWSIASVASGGIGYYTAGSDEWKSFHEMNAIVGVVNGGIAAYGMLRTRQQLLQAFDMKRAWHNYQADKKVIYVNIGLDLGCMITGAYLLNRAQNYVPNKDVNLGLGRSLILQGAFLVILDNVMLVSHNKNSGRWARILHELSFTGNGFSYVHTF